MISRRRFLRGAFHGAAVTVGLPLLDVFLNENGTALASGMPLPQRFGTWFWGCGMNPNRWNPTTEGSDFQLPPELLPIAPVRDHISVLSGMSALLNGEANQVHFTGMIGTLTGEAPTLPKESPLPTVDTLIADQIGTSTRFRSLEMTATGNPKHSYSQRNASLVNPAEPTPLALYQRVFGPGFVEPNAAHWAPDPQLAIRQSAISIVADDRKRLEAGLGGRDRARLDEYFTSLRQLEHQLEVQQEQPPPLPSCERPPAPEAGTANLEIDRVHENHRLLSEILALTLACDQTRVFNVVFSNLASGLHKAGDRDTHHTLTHEEPRDAALGYQPRAGEFVLHSMEAWASFVQTLASVPEGDGTLLDNCLVMAHSESSDANTHSVVGLPVMFAGRAGGRVRTGIHVRAAGDSTSRASLTAQVALGLPVSRFGTKQNQTSRAIGELLV